ncbi:hypothetical protein T09_13907, partial [Trichinella sp. T9]
MPRLLFIKLLSSIISKDRVADVAFKKRQKTITSSAEFLWCSFCSGQRDESCSHHFVLNVASQTSLDRTVFGAVTSCFPSCFSVVSLIIFMKLSQSSSVRINPDNVLVLVAVSAFRICGLRHPMKLVPLATLVHMEIKAFPRRPSVPLLITNSIVH